jgi:hypothetical protein
VFLVGLVHSAHAGAHRCTAFIGKAIAAWERETAGRATELLEKAAQSERSLSSRVTSKAAEELAQTIRTWAKLTAPQRAQELATVLRHQGSVIPVSRWRELAIDIANEQGAAREALIVIEKLVEDFHVLPDLGARLREDLETCRSLVLASREREAIGELEAAIAEADTQRDKLSHSLDGNEPYSTAPTLVTRLRDALIQAVRTAPRRTTPSTSWRAMRAGASMQVTTRSISLIARSASSSSSNVAPDCRKPASVPGSGDTSAEPAISLGTERSSTARSRTATARSPRATWMISAMPSS